MNGDRYVSEKFFSMAEGLISNEVSSLAEHLYDGNWKSARPDERAKYYVLAHEAISYMRDNEGPPF